MSQVTTNPEARVGRFSVSRAQEPPPAVQATNGPSDPGPTLSSDPAHKTSLPSLNNNSFNNSYISSDNDSEFEDEDFRREVRLLREKQVTFSSSPSSTFPVVSVLITLFLVKDKSSEGNQTLL